MKKYSLIVLSILLMLDSHAQMAEAIIEQHLQAIGGREKLGQIKTLVREGQIDRGGPAIKVVISQVHNEAIRISYSIMGMSGFSIITPQKGWTYMPAAGQTDVQQMPEAERLFKQNELDLQSLLLNYKDKGYAASTCPQEMFDGVLYHCLLLRSESGAEIRFLIDPATYLLARRTNTQRINGLLQQTSTEYSDYRELNGLKIAFTMKEQMGAIHFSKITLNEPIDERVFMPIKNGGVQ